MKKILLTFIGLLAVILTANAGTVEKSYTLSFMHTGAGDGNQLNSTSIALNKIFEEASLEYVSGLAAVPTITYYNSKMGLKLGSGSGVGSVTFTLSETAQVKVTKMMVEWASYGSDTSGVEITVGNETVKTDTSNKNTLATSELTLAEPQDATTITIASYGSNAKKARAFVQSVVVYYEEEVSGPVAPQYSNVPENVKLTVGDKMDYPAIEPSDLTYSFSADPAGILTFDDAAKTITAAGIGTATVKFTTAAMGDYEAGEGSFEVEVVGKTPELSFANPVVYGKVGSGVVWQTVTITEPAHTDAKVTYTSSDPEIVAVDAATGRINVADVKKAGEVVITATLPASGDYAEGTASYTISVINTDVSAIEPGEAIFNFNVENPYGMTSTSDSNFWEKNVKEIVSGNGLVTLSFAGNYRSWIADNYGLRVNKNATVTIAVPAGYKLTKVVIEGSITGNLDGLTNAAGKTWTAGEGVVKNSIVLSSTGTTKINSILVMYESAGSALKSPELIFEKNDYSMMVGEATTINAATAPEGVEVVYAIEGLNADEYSITEDGANLNVTVDKAGYYTLTAKSAATDEYTDGFEIMRLNVYAPVTAYADGEEITSNTFEAEADGDEDTVTITFDLPANDYLYYKLESIAATTVKAADDESDDENQLPGYTLYNDGIEIPAGFNGTLSYYQANYGFLSPVKTLAISIPTGVAEIAIDEEGAVRYYDLNGREVKGQLDSGIYVRLRNGKATKILVK